MVLAHNIMPALTERGLLPPGVHKCNLKQLQLAFAFNVRREQLFESLQHCVSQMHDRGLAGTLYIDGSYVTSKPNPRDIEITLDVAGQTVAMQDRALAYHVREHQALTKNGVDWWPSYPGAPRNFVDFFQYVGEKTAATLRCSPLEKKGILRITRW